MWQVERLSKNDIKLTQMIEFLNACFKNWGDMGYWNWKYEKKNLLNMSSNAWFIRNASEVIGFYGHVPLKIKINKNVYFGSQAVDSATHPNYRRKGIFAALDKTSVFHAGEEGTKVFYGLGVIQESTKGHITKGNWKLWCQGVTLIRILDLRKLGHKYLKKIFIEIPALNTLNQFLVPKIKKKGPSYVETDEISQFDSKIISLYDRASRKFDFIVERSPEYLNWRVSHPRKNYHIFVANINARICGYMVIHHNKILNRYEIEDYLYDGNPVVFDCLIKYVLIRAFNSRCASVTATITQHHPYSVMFYKNLFFRIRNRTQYICHYENICKEDQIVFKKAKSAVHLTRFDKNE